MYSIDTEDMPQKRMGTASDMIDVNITYLGLYAS
jgi:hypothetical protein